MTAARRRRPALLASLGASAVFLALAARTVLQARSLLHPARDLVTAGEASRARTKEDCDVDVAVTAPRLACGSGLMTLVHAACAVQRNGHG